MCMQSPCRVETHTCPVGRVVCFLGTICLQTMRIPFALCAWALLLAAPLTHGLTVRAPAKLLATPQSVILMGRGLLGFEVGACLWLVLVLCRLCVACLSGVAWL